MFETVFVDCGCGCRVLLYVFVCCFSSDFLSIELAQLGLCAAVFAD